MGTLSSTIRAMGWLGLMSLVACSSVPTSDDPADTGRYDIGERDADRRDGMAVDATPDGPTREDARPVDAAPIDAAPIVDAIPPGPDAVVNADGTAGEPLPPTPLDGTAGRYRTVELARYPHDENAFTQGLLIHDGQLYESTGLYGFSSVRQVDLATGAVEERTDLERRLFGEGLAAIGDRLIQVTWRSGVGIVYDRATLAEQSRFRYAGEGWGLTYDGVRLIMSDGSARLRFFDPDTFDEIGAVDVLDGDRAINRLNELEFIDGEVLANVWMTDDIVRINPITGRVIGWIDASALRPAGAGQDDVLNGIAWDAPNRRLLLTGKRWPVLYSVRIESLDDDEDDEGDDD